MTDQKKGPKIGAKEYDEETQRIAREFLERAQKAGPLKDEHGVLSGSVKTLNNADVAPHSDVSRKI